MGRQDFETETLIPTGGGFDVAHALKGEGFDGSEDGTGRGVPIVAAPLSAANGAKSNTGGRRREDDENPVVADTLRNHPRAGSNSFGAIAFTQNQEGDVLTGERTPSMGTNQNATGRNTPKVQCGMNVRRLTPRECERLQGFPDDYTLVPYRGKLAADGPRYKALGNSMTTKVMRKIGERIEMVTRI